ncbi:MAG TPA: hypothetical protein VNW30_00595 [Opitutaceae bacterium]|jgi:hypothetical protein|nr:hypothetical protein [Opitutaceae bacterium]
MWPKLKDQLPAILVTAVLVTLAAYFIHQQTVSEMAKSQQDQLATLRDEMKAATDENSQRIEAINSLLKDAMAKRQAEMLMTDEEFAKVNADKVNQLATAIAQKIQPYNPLPKTPEEAERQQNEQVDKVSTRLSEKIHPILADMAADQHLTRDSINAYSQKITDQVGVVLTGEMAKNQVLNNNVVATQDVARDSLGLSREVTALYLSSFKDQGVLSRLLMLPADVINDTAHLSLVNSNEREKIEQQLVIRMNELQKRLDELQGKQPKN